MSRFVQLLIDQYINVHLMDSMLLIENFKFKVNFPDPNFNLLMILISMWIFKMSLVGVLVVGTSQQQQQKVEENLSHTCKGGKKTAEFIYQTHCLIYNIFS